MPPLVDPSEYMNPHRTKKLVREKDPHGKDLHEPGAKADEGKIRVDLMLSGFHSALWEIARVTTVGAKKYTPNGWHSVLDGEARYRNASKRHFLLGCSEMHDSQTGLFHDAQEIWNLLAAFQLKLERIKNARILVSPSLK